MKCYFVFICDCSQKINFIYLKAIDEQTSEKSVELDAITIRTENDQNKSLRMMPY